MRVAALVCAAGVAALPAAGGQSDIACATTDLLEEKAICAWEAYREAAFDLAQTITRTLVVVKAYEAAGEPADEGKAEQMLVDGQTAWEEYRQKTCQLESHLYFGGPGTSYGYAACLNRLTRLRLDDLRVVLDAD